MFDEDIVLFTLKHGEHEDVRCIAAWMMHHYNNKLMNPLSLGSFWILT